MARVLFIHLYTIHHTPYIHDVIKCILFLSKNKGFCLNKCQYFCYFMSAKEMYLAASQNTTNKSTTRKKYTSPSL